MTQQTSTNSVGSNNNHNPNIGRDKGRFRRVFGGWGGHGSQGDCKNNTSIVEALFEGRLKDGAYISALPVKGYMEPQNSKKNPWHSANPIYREGLQVSWQCKLQQPRVG